MHIEEHSNKLVITPETKIEIVFLFSLLRKHRIRVGKEITWREKIESGTKTKRTKGQKIHIIIEPEDTRIDSSLTSLRVTGSVLYASNDILLGRRMGFDIRINDYLYMYDNIITKYSTKFKKQTKITIIILDIDGYLIAEVNELINIVKEKYISPQEFLNTGLTELKKEMEYINNVINSRVKNGEYVIVAFNAGTKNIAKKISRPTMLVEGPYSADLSGVISLLKEKHEVLNKEIKNSTVESLGIYSIITDTRNIGKLIYDRETILEYVRAKAIRGLIITEKTLIREALYDLIYDAITSCINVIITPDGTSLGLLINRYGGLVGITY